MVTWLSLIIGSLPALIWLAFFLWEDEKRPEPKRLILSTFILGGIIAFIALQFQVQLNKLLLSFGAGQFGFTAVLLMAGIEEVLKFLLVYWWVHKRKEFDEPIDAMVYLIIAALGFATVENIASVSRSAAGLELMTLRFVGATLLHSLSSGLVGFYWAKAIVYKQHLLGKITQGLIIAILVHGAFNILVLKYGPAWQATIFLAFVGFFVLNDFEDLKKRTD